MIEDSPSRTRRQWIAQLLEEREHGFEELCLLLQLRARELDDELRHVERSTRRSAQRLEVVPARCASCGFSFRDRAPRRFRPPGRCPRCRSERIQEPRFRLV